MTPTANVPFVWGDFVLRPVDLPDLFSPRDLVNTASVIGQALSCYATLIFLWKTAPVVRFTSYQPWGPIKQAVLKPS